MPSTGHSTAGRGTREVSRHQPHLRGADKFANRRDELAGAALKTLSQLGYARTSLREIAQNSEFSHGVLHYYFNDKSELIVHCVRQYKRACMTRYDETVEQATTAEDLRESFAQVMSLTLRDEGHLHRLWYDMRSQSLFEPTLRETVVDLEAGLESMIWRVVTRYAELSGRPIVVSSAMAYGLFDGMFQHALLRQQAGDACASSDLETGVVRALPLCVPAV